MNTAIVNVKVDRLIKRKAQRVAADLGLSLSALINAFLKQLIRTKTVTFTAAEEIPSDYFIEMLRQSEEDIKKGRVVSFKTGREAIKYLHGLEKEA